MPVVDLQVVQTPSSTGYSDQFTVELTFEHENDDITENGLVEFPAGTDKAQIIELINTLWAANDHIVDSGREPEDDEVENYEKWCSREYGKPGIDCWPSDHNGNYFAVLQFVAVAYYGADGTRYEVNLVEE